LKTLGRVAGTSEEGGELLGERSGDTGLKLPETGLPWEAEGLRGALLTGLPLRVVKVTGGAIFQRLAGLKEERIGELLRGATLDITIFTAEDASFSSCKTTPSAIAVSLASGGKRVAV